MTVKRRVEIIESVSYVGLENDINIRLEKHEAAGNIIFDIQPTINNLSGEDNFYAVIIYGVQIDG